MTEVDAVVALCEWVKAVLLRNGVAPSKVVVSRQGLSDWNRDRSTAFEERSQQSPLRVAFFGRLDPTKGIHILVDAISSAPDLPVTLDVFGVVQGDGNSRYVRMLRARAADDSRISFPAPVSPQGVVAQMRRYDVVAVPSQWLESGPLVVMEAFAAGVPVIGSDLGGIAELVTHNVDGIRIEPGSSDAWRTALQAFCRDSQLLATLRNGVSSPRIIADVACDMAALYKSIVRRAETSEPGDEPCRVAVDRRSFSPTSAGCVH
jgi:glycosyltransferase involved in cell wall biosynthesis